MATIVNIEQILGRAGVSQITRDADGRGLRFPGGFQLLTLPLEKEYFLLKEIGEVRVESVPALIDARFDSTCVALDAKGGMVKMGVRLGPIPVEEAADVKGQLAELRRLASNLEHRLGALCTAKPPDLGEHGHTLPPTACYYADTRNHTGFASFLRVFLAGGIGPRLGVIHAPKGAGKTAILSHVLLELGWNAAVPPSKLAGAPPADLAKAVWALADQLRHAEKLLLFVPCWLGNVLHKDFFELASLALSAISREVPVLVASTVSLPLPGETARHSFANFSEQELVAIARAHGHRIERATEPSGGSVGNPLFMLQQCSAAEVVQVTAPGFVTTGVWLEKIRASGYAGQDQPVAATLDFLRGFDLAPPDPDGTGPKNPIIMLGGPPGLGKTTLARAICRKALGVELVELDFSQESSREFASSRLYGAPAGYKGCDDASAATLASVTPGSLLRFGTGIVFNEVEELAPHTDLLIGPLDGRYRCMGKEVVLFKNPIFLTTNYMSSDFFRGSPLFSGMSNSTGLRERLYSNDNSVFPAKFMSRIGLVVFLDMTQAPTAQSLMEFQLKQLLAGAGVEVICDVPRLVAHVITKFPEELSKGGYRQTYSLLRTAVLSPLIRYIEQGCRRIHVFVQNGVVQARPEEVQSTKD